MFVYAGIDEAGYGPMLGPLCVGMGVIEMPDDSGNDVRSLDVWERFPAAVCRRPSDAGTSRIAVDDSKALKLPNSVTTRDPLAHLERAVLASLGACGCFGVCTDAQLYETLGLRTSGLPWYGGGTLDLPLDTTADHIGLLGALVRRSFERGACRFGNLRCACVDERVFNRLYDGAGSKASVSMRVVSKLMRELASSYGDRPGTMVRLVIDRQGGRRSYANSVRRALGTDRVTVIRESERASEYEAALAGGAEMRIVFSAEADREHFPVALASMTAKLVRELMMRRFNRYWNARLPELKPTAGYVTDARRWLSDASAAITRDERTILVRKA